MAVIEKVKEEAVKQLFRRFFDKIERVGGCWIWLGSTNKDGYGLFHLLGKMQSAHRVSYELHIGDIPEGMEIDHICRERSCVNPAHLEPVSRQENLDRMILAKTHCINGHDYKESSFIHLKGFRECSICAKKKKLAWQRRNRDKGKGLRANWTHCVNGHEFTAENTIRNKKTNQRRCRICRDKWLEDKKKSLQCQ